MATFSKHTRTFICTWVDIVPQTEPQLSVSRPTLLYSGQHTGPTKLGAWREEMMQESLLSINFVNMTRVDKKQRREFL